jgi:diguanylate cyclase (GGDEF)-like protein
VWLLFESIMDTSNIIGDVFRLDPLTGCKNLLAFSEALMDGFYNQSQDCLSLLFLDLNHFARVNDERGLQHGDAVLRWIGLLLREETQAQAFRVGGDEFVAVLTQGTHEEQAAAALKLFERLNQEAEGFGLRLPAASIAVVHYCGDKPVIPADVWVQLSQALFDVKTKANRTLDVFHAEMLPVADFHMHWVIDRMLQRMTSLGDALDEALHMAYTDPVSGLPNMLAAQRALEQAVAERKPFTLLLIDGDDLRNYNKISYAAGDAMIHRLGLVLHTRLRPGDFLARWRVGDEFLVLLPNSLSQQGMQIGERLCASLREASREWPIPVTISIGVASYPQHGETADRLIDQAMLALERAKEAGKNQVCLAE